MNEEEISKLKEAGEIAKQVKEFAKKIIKPEMPLIEIAEKIDEKILELGGKPAFPVNLSINEIAAHSTPSHNDETKAEGLLKVDIGVQIDGFIADTAFSLDLDNSKENKNLIEAAEAGLEAGIKAISLNTTTTEIGKAISSVIASLGFQPITNLTGHEIKQYDLHAGLTIPNYENPSSYKIQEGTYAIEPFSTNGFGTVRDGKPSGIYIIKKEGNVRDPFARKVLQFIIEEYQSLPFCSRWLVKTFGTRAIISLRQLEQADILHQYPQLIEKNSGKVAQAEHTVIVTKEKKIVTT